MVRKNRTRNLEIPGSMLAHRPGMTGQDMDARVKPELDERDGGTTTHCMAIGEKSTNQLFGCTKFFTFGLMARGATSCAT